MEEGRPLSHSSSSVDWTLTERVAVDVLVDAARCGQRSRSPDVIVLPFLVGRGEQDAALVDVRTSYVVVLRNGEKRLLGGDDGGDGGDFRHGVQRVQARL